MARLGEKRTVKNERIDPATGEVLSSSEKVSIVAIGSPKPDKDQQYVRIYPAFFSSFLEELGIDDGKARMVLYFVYRAMQLPPESNNEIIAMNEDLMRILKISRPTLFKYLNDLIALGIIKRKHPRMPVYVIEREMIYRGSVVKMYKRELEAKINEFKNNENDEET